MVSAMSCVPDRQQISATACKRNNEHNHLVQDDELGTMRFLIP